MSAIWMDEFPLFHWIVPVFIMIIDADSAISLFPETKVPYFNFGSDEEARDADELQRWLEDISLCGHEAIEVVLGQVIRLPMQFVHFAHLRWECNNFFSVLEQIIFLVDDLNHSCVSKNMSGGVGQGAHMQEPSDSQLLDLGAHSEPNFKADSRCPYSSPSEMCFFSVIHPFQFTLKLQDTRSHFGLRILLERTLKHVV